MRLLFLVALPGVLVISACSSPAPTASAPTAAVAPTSSTAASPAAKPASPVASPAASVSASPSPASKPAVAASPAASAVASPSAGPAVLGPMLFSGTPTPAFTLQSSAFTDGANLPSEFSCDGPGGGQSPPLSWTGAPTSTRAFVLVDQDPDAGSGGNIITHWLVYNIPATVTQLEAGQPPQDRLPNGAFQGLNARRAIGYLGSCPPAGTPGHHYTFQLFALDGPLSVQPGGTIIDVQQAMTGHVVGQTRIVAVFGH